MVWALFTVSATILLLESVRLRFQECSPAGCLLSLLLRSAITSSPDLCSRSHFFPLLLPLYYRFLYPGVGHADLNAA